MTLSDTYFILIINPQICHGNLFDCRNVPSEKSNEFKNIYALYNEKTLKIWGIEFDKKSRIADIFTNIPKS